MANYSDIKSSGGGVTAYANFAALPTSGNAEGALAFTQDTDALYMWEGTSWTRVYSGPDEILSFDNDPASEYILLDDGTATNINLPATDPEGFPITYSYDTNPSNQTQATITSSGSTFTLTPSTDPADTGTFTLRFKATDGLHSVSKTSSVNLSFAPVVDYLVVAGGGGGSAGDNGGSGGGGGGGGAGGALTGTNLTLATGTVYDIIVGAGGVGRSHNNSPNYGTNGGNSSISGTGLTTITAIGGGYGGTTGTAIGSGGSGGGGGGRGGAVGTGTAGQGNNGGPGGNWGGGGGGGGAGSVGGSASGGIGGDGGDGIQSSITGTATYYAGGGGGGGNGTSYADGAGGLGGGGTGNTSAGTANTGGGGGGQKSGVSNGAKNGGSGIVILRTLKGHTSATITGTYTHTTDGYYNIYSFTGNGSISWT